MLKHDRLAAALRGIDGRGYKAYRRIQGRWALPGFSLTFDHVQGDPFASPSRARIHIDPEDAGLPPEACRRGARAIGTGCLLARTFCEVAEATSGRRGSGRSGLIAMATPGQKVLENTAVMVSGDGGVEARFTVGLPARGRKVLGRQAVQLLLEDLPRVVEESLVGRAHDPEQILLHAKTNEDAEALRSQLPAYELVAFVADGAHLPRMSGVDDRPLQGDAVVPFRSPETLQLTLQLPNAGEMSGMGVPKGITLIVGGGYHGKSTLLEALGAGVYNHRPGDGREHVVTAPDAVGIRSEDGRSVASVDVSAFIDDLPGGTKSRRYSSENASGSTSQAAAIMEALEAGASVLLIDEDTAATNLMIRDRRMQALVPKAREPITPFIDRVRELHKTRGISSILVIGGSGEYLEVADTVIEMRGHLPAEVTAKALEVAKEHPSGRVPESSGPIAPSPPRRPIRNSIEPGRGRRKVHVVARGSGTILFGTGEIDLSAVGQVVSEAQIRGISRGLVLAWERFMDEALTVPEILDRVLQAVEESGLDALGRENSGDLALFRRHELAAALNRLRGLEIDDP